MNNRTIITFIVAGIMVLMVMCASVVMIVVGWVGTEKFEITPGQKLAFANAQSMKLIDLTGDGQNDLFAQNLDEVIIFGSGGEIVFDQSYTTPMVTTMGEVTGDGVEDVVVFSPAGVDIVSQGQVVLNFPVQDLIGAERAVIIRYPSGPQIVLGDSQGKLAAYSPQGELRWQAAISSGDVVRGLDDALFNGQRYLAAANHDGTVSVYDEKGTALWTYSLNSLLRRLRAYDLNGDGVSELLVGGESGRFVMLDAASGSELRTYSPGQIITEIRSAEINGEPSSLEIIIGGKEGGVWALDYSANLLWSSTLTGKVTEIGSIDVERDGKQEIVVGDENGDLQLFSADGLRTGFPGSNPIITRVDAGSYGSGSPVVIATAADISLYSLSAAALPILRFTPLLFGLIASFVILAAAWVVASLPSRPPERVALEDQSPEGLTAQRRMIQENIADVERLRKAGEMTPDAYLIRLKELRQRLADNETALRKAGVTVTAQTFQCPHCGGVLPLGVDKCDYCKQTVLT